jgi:hypothetical protein
MIDANAIIVSGIGGAILKTTNGGSTFVSEEHSFLNSFIIQRNYPNPFTPASSIKNPASGV